VHESVDSMVSSTEEMARPANVAIATPTRAG
jgi:hypothetical protein